MQSKVKRLVYRKRNFLKAVSQLHNGLIVLPVVIESSLSGYSYSVNLSPYPHPFYLLLKQMICVQISFKNWLTLSVLVTISEWNYYKMASSLCTDSGTQSLCSVQRKEWKLTENWRNRRRGIKRRSKWSRINGPNLLIHHKYFEGSIQHVCNS